MEIKAKARYIRMSPKKVRLVARAIHNMDIEMALGQLKFINKAATRPIQKLLNSAVANAKHNFGIEKENLYIKEINVQDGPTLKRWRPRAFGRAGVLRKRSSHIFLVLKEKKEKEKKTASQTANLKAPKLVKELPKEKEEKSQDFSQKVVKKAKDQKEKPEARDEKTEIFDVREKGKHRHKEHLDKVREKGKGGIVKRIFRRKAG